MDSISIPEEDIKDNLLVVDKVVKKYSNGHLALKDASFSMKKGECLGLVGESGSGKSTLARCILMFERIDKGEIWLNGEAIHNMKKTEFRKNKEICRQYFKTQQLH